MHEQPTIRRATEDELEFLPAIEVESYSLYGLVGMDQVASSNKPDLDALRAAQSAGNVLVAARAREIAGFIECRVVDGTLYVAGLSVAPRFGRRGIGAALLASAEDLGRQQDLTRMSLTTFRDVPWNGPYYERLGWRSVVADQSMPGLIAIRSRQREAGHERWPRVTMLKDVHR